MQRTKPKRRNRPNPSVRNFNTVMSRNSEFPKPYNANLSGVKRFRFVESSAGAATYNITPAKLGALCTIGTSGTTVTGLFDTVRIISVEAWAPSPNMASSTPQPISITFQGIAPGVQGESRTKSDYSMGMTHNAHVKLVPPVNSQAGHWQNTNVNNTTAQTGIFEIISPATTQIIVDVVIAWKATTTSRPNANSGFTVAAAVLGSYYYMALDNAAGGTGSVGNVLIPDQSLVTTA